MSDGTIIVVRGTLAFAVLAPSALLGWSYLGGVAVGIVAFVLSKTIPAIDEASS